MRKDAKQIGATYLGHQTGLFRVWSPGIDHVRIRLLDTGRIIAMEKTDCGYHEAIVGDVSPGALYRFQLGESVERPDPASRFQPRGVHGPSALLDPEFPWEDTRWSGIALEDYVIYELHIGAFTAAGTFESVIPHLNYLAELGITAVQLMPVAQFPGSRNWGYDGVYPFAAQNSYGGPKGLKNLVNACHQRGLAVILDVVYNHLGPEGNYLGEYGPYFTDIYRSPWGPALNFDGAYSDDVREYFIQNALQWLVDFHVDALRLDAVHAILDRSPVTFLEELSAAVGREASRLDRRMFLFAESADNNARLLRTSKRGGYALDAQWNDDFHHSLRALLTGDRSGYYGDYGDFAQLVKAYREGFVYSGEYSPFRKRRHGSSSRDIPARKFVVFSQNHDQVGNHKAGDRLTQAVSFEQLKLAAALVVLSPSLPLLFMGEEYGETAPFPFFVSHSDSDLVEAVRQGRRMEFASFGWQGIVPDPQDEATFLSAKLHHEVRDSGVHKILLEFYRELLKLRKTIPALAQTDKDRMAVTGYPNEKILAVERWCSEDRALMVANLGAADNFVAVSITQRHWRKVFDSAKPQWRGSGGALPDELDGGNDCQFSIAAHSVVLYLTEDVS